jgi:hypothetical protein
MTFFFDHYLTHNLIHLRHSIVPIPFLNAKKLGGSIELCSSHQSSRDLSICSKFLHRAEKRTIGRKEELELNLGIEMTLYDFQDGGTCWVIGILTRTRAAAVTETTVAVRALISSHQPSVRGTQRRRDTPSSHPSPDRACARSRQRPQVPRFELCCFSDTAHGDTSHQRNCFFFFCVI